MTTYSSILAWEIPWTEKPSRLVHGVAKHEQETVLTYRGTYRAIVKSLSKEMTLNLKQEKKLLNEERSLK